MRSGYEEKIKKSLIEREIPFEYETEVLTYIIPESKHKYTPDFIFRRTNGTLYVEAKGILDSETRKKMLLVIQQNPSLDIRMLFMRDQKLRKGSKTFYSDWANKNSVKFAVGNEVPIEWIQER